VIGVLSERDVSNPVPPTQTAIIRKRVAQSAEAADHESHARERPVDEAPVDAVRASDRAVIGLR